MVWKVHLLLFCDYTATEHWTPNVVTGAYYQVNMQSALTWSQADTSCKQQAASLVSIVDPAEKAFITGKVPPAGCVRAPRLTHKHVERLFHMGCIKQCTTRQPLSVNISNLHKLLMRWDKYLLLVLLFCLSWNSCKKTLWTGFPNPGVYLKN